MTARNNSNNRQSGNVGDSPITMEKLLSDVADMEKRISSNNKIDSPPLSQEHQDLHQSFQQFLASPNALDWERRLLPLVGASPNAFQLSLDAKKTTAHGESKSPLPTLFDYPPSQQSQKGSQGPSSQSLDALSTILLMEQMAASSAGAADAAPHPSMLTEDFPIEGNYYHSMGNGALDSPFSTSGTSNASASLETYLKPLPRRSHTDRQESHRESERRRRQSLQNSMSRLESIVMLSLNRNGAADAYLSGGAGAKKKLAHAEIYRLAREIIVALKSEVAQIEHQNCLLAARLKE